MYQKNLLTMLMAGVAAIALPAYSQMEGPGQQDVTVQAFGSFLKTTTQNGLDHTATNSAGVLTSYRYFFSKHHGVEGNYGYTQNTQKYMSAGGRLGVDTNSHEISSAYVYRMPLRNVTPFALGGVAALVFDPKNFTSASTQTRAAFVYGAGADINLSQHIFIRGQYRGLIYNSPTYDLPRFSGLDRVTHRAEPTIGFGYTF